MRPHSKIALILAVIFASLVSAACPGTDAVTGSSSSGSGDWWYHFACNGDEECLATNFAGKPSGDVNEGPQYVNCKSLLDFASHFWGSAATNSCDHSPKSSSGGSASGVARVTVTPSATSIVVGAKATLTATAYDANNNVLSGAVFTWTSSNLSIVGGTYANNVETAVGVAVGNATLIATTGGVSGQAIVTVTAPVIASVVISPFTSYVAVGATVTLTAVALDANGTVIAGAVFDWTSSSLAIVSGTFNNGVLTATGNSAGTAVIHATSGGHEGTATITAVQSTATTFDGTYSYNFTVKNANGNEVTTSPALQFIVLNGVITSNPAGFHGVVIDMFGAVSFQGVCPAPASPIGHAVGTATYTGTLNFGSGLAKNGSGSWTCNSDAGNNAGLVDHWTVFNGH